MRVPQGSLADMTAPMELMASSMPTSFAMHHTTLGKEDHRAWASLAMPMGSGSPAPAASIMPLSSPYTMNWTLTQG